MTVVTEEPYYRRVRELVPDGLPFSGLVAALPEALDLLWVGEAGIDPATGRASARLFVEVPVELAVPGVESLTVVVSPGSGGVEFMLEAGLVPVFSLALREVSLALRVSGDVLRPVKPGTTELDPDRDHVDITLPRVDLEVTGEGHVSLTLPDGIDLERAMIGTSGVIVEAEGLRWLTLADAAPHASAPAAFAGLYVESASLDLPGLTAPPGASAFTLRHLFIGTGGVTGSAALQLAATWDGTRFTGPGRLDELFGFDGCLTAVSITVRQCALTAFDVSGSVRIPWLDRVVGVTIGVGDDGLTAIARTPTCQFTPAAAVQAAGAGPSGYLLTVTTEAGILDLNRVEFQAGSSGASVTLAGRIAVSAAGFDIPPVVFQGLRIATDGRVTVEGGWLDVESVRTASLKGFPLQITKVGFGAEADGRRWIGLNGAIKLADPLPIGASVEGLRVSWAPGGGNVRFSLEGIGVEMSSPGTFSFAGSAAFFSGQGASGFRGSIKLSLNTLKLDIDASIMVGRTDDGTAFFFLYLDITLPAGIPLFSTGAAIYGFAGLLAVNLRPDRHDGQHWYHGYYRRSPSGVTRAEKWAVRRDAFAIGLGTTIGSLPDLGYTFAAKLLLVIVLPGPQLILNGKGGFLVATEEGDTAEGQFEALLVLDIPGRLFQVNLSARYMVQAEDPKLVDVGGGVDVAFTWADAPPPDYWHVYLGEKTPSERRIHATLLKIVQGDAWVMVNRPGSFQGLKALTPERLGEFELGGSVSIGGDWRFGPLRAWFEAVMEGGAGISVAPEQFSGYLEVRGGAGLSVFCFRIEAVVRARADAKAPTPWWLAIAVEAGIKIDLFFWKFEKKVRFPLRWGDEHAPLPSPVTGIASIAVEHPKVDEDRALDGVTVPGDAKPLITFSRPVTDGARFGSPGPISAPPEQVGPVAFSYHLRHVVLRTAAGGLVGAAGQAVAAGTTVSFPGIPASGADALPPLAGAALSVVDDTFTERGPWTVVSGGGNSAVLSGAPPAGTHGYRLSAPRPSARVEVAAVVAVADGSSLLTLASAPADPERFDGGTLDMEGQRWPVLAVAGAQVRVLTGTNAPAIGPAILDGPNPAAVEACWAAVGAPGDLSSATRLSIGAKTPFGFYRRNEIESVKGLDPFTGPYACGPAPTEEPICLDIAGMADGPLSGAVSIDGVQATTSGFVRKAGAEIQLGQATGGNGTITFTLTPPADAVWVTAKAAESGRVTVRRDGAVVRQATLDATGQQLRAPGADEVEITGTLVTVSGLCYLPGWTCTHFSAVNFPQGATGSTTYAGLNLHSPGIMTVDGAGVLVVTAGPQEARPLPPHLIAWLLGDDRTATEFGLTGTVLEVNDLERESVAAVPAVGEVVVVPPGRTAAAGPSLVRAFLDGATEVPAPLLRGRARLGAPAMLTVVMPAPATRVRISLDGDATVIALAGEVEVDRGHGTASASVALVANPAGPARIGWCDRVAIIAPTTVRITQFCTDAGPFGWARFEQWRWSKGVQRAVESMYRPDTILRPGTYRLQVHTATVTTGAAQGEQLESTSASFAVGEPPGFPSGGTPAGLAGATYPNGGPLTDLTTYTAGTVPAAGIRPWYRKLDTGVVFNEGYVTRMYLQTGRELRVVVRDASGRIARGPTPHRWGTTQVELDGWTWEWVRTLNGDGSDPCATVDLDRMTKPEAVSAGGGEPLAPAELHRSQLVATAKAGERVVHNFEFVTSRFTDIVQHLATFDGRCRREPAAAAAAPTDLAALAAAWINTADGLAALAVDARTKAAAARSGTVPAAAIEADRAARAALVASRAAVGASGVTDFTRYWSSWLGELPGGGLPVGLMLSALRVPGPGGGNVLLLESPEPLDWDRLAVTAAAGAPLALELAVSAPGGRFGAPDAGFVVEHGGLRWRAGVELWAAGGAVRAKRDDEDLDVTIEVGWATGVTLRLALAAGEAATVTTIPPRATGAMTVAAPSEGGEVTATVAAGRSEPVSALTVTGRGAGVVSVTAARRFAPSVPDRELRISEVVLPTAANPSGHHVTVVALAPVPSLDGWRLEWSDPDTPGEPALYAQLPRIALADGDRLRLFPGLAQPPVLDDVLATAGGPGDDPPIHGVIMRLLDPLGRVAHETVATVASAATHRVAAVADRDGTRALLINTDGGFTSGWWTLTFDTAADAGPDLPLQSVAGRPENRTASLRFEVPS